MHLLRSLLIVTCLTCPALASALDLTYSVQGFGGTSQPQGPFTDSFPWIDWTGGVPGSELTSYGFNPVLPGTDVQYHPDFAGGSLLLSSPFMVDGASTLTVTTALLTSFSPYEPTDVGFTLLVREGANPTVLSNLRQNGDTTFFTYFQGGETPWNVFTPSSDGVTTTYTTDGPTALTGMVLGDREYGRILRTGDCSADCLTTVTSTVTPGAGTYQLLFGVYDLFKASDRRFEEGRRMDPSIALAVKGVAVPEPSSLVFLVMSLGAVFLVGRRVRQV